MAKSTKAESRYTPRASNPNEQCADCKHFLGILGCQKVEGSISPRGWCKYFEKRKGE
jgi:hypothetical protein